MCLESYEAFFADGLLRTEATVTRHLNFLGMCVTYNRNIATEPPVARQHNKELLYHPIIILKFGSVNWKSDYKKLLWYNLRTTQIHYYN